MRQRHRLPTLAGSRHRVFACILPGEHGFNLGAWDHAWRQVPQHRSFLFLQDDYRVFRRHWLRAILHRFKSVRGCGLVGEYLNRDWGRRWPEMADLDSASAMALESSDRETCTESSQVVWEWLISGSTVVDDFVLASRTDSHIAVTYHRICKKLASVTASPLRRFGPNCH